MPDARIAERAISLVGMDAVRLGAPSDAIEGVVPRVIVEPESSEAAALSSSVSPAFFRASAPAGASPTASSLS